MTPGNWIPLDRNLPEERGNPIFDGRSSALNRAFRIMQHRPIGDDVEIDAWVKSCREDTDLPRHELFFNLSVQCRRTGDTLGRKACQA
jgi:hypothetical protein